MNLAVDSSLPPLLILVDVCSLFDGLVGDDRRVEDLLSEGLQHLLPVVVEPALDLVNRLFFDDPEL